MAYRSVAAAVAVALLLTGCVPAGQETPSARPEIGTQFGIPYMGGDGAEVVAHTLDLYPAARTESSPAPLIVWTGGNAWLEATGANTAGSVAAIFGPHGYAVAGVNIRSSGQATFPAQLNDMRAAIHFLKTNAKRYNLDPERFGVAGDSSGGWAALMVALTAHTGTGAGAGAGTTDGDRVGAAAAFYPPTDLAAIDQYLPANCATDRPTVEVSACQADANSAASRLLGCAIPLCPPSLVELATPITFVDNDDPPVLLMHGSTDDVVPWQQSAELFDAVTAAHGRAELVLVPRGGHGQASLWVTAGPVGVDATLTSTAEGTVTGPTPLFLDAEVLVDFFDRAFKNG